MSRGYILTLNSDTEFFTETCCNCGVLFAMTRDYERRVRKTGASWHCPNGHPQHYTPGPSAEKQLRDAEARETALKDQLSAAVRDAEQTRAALLRDRARFAAEELTRRLALVEQLHHELGGVDLEEIDVLDLWERLGLALRGEA